MRANKPRCTPLILAALVFHYPNTSPGQGTVEFRNLNTGAGVNAPVYQSDRVTRLSGSQFIAELLGGPGVDNLASLATTGFLTGNGAGYFNGPYQTINGVSPAGFAWVQVDVWNTASGASFAQAQASGLPNSWWQFSVFEVQTGGPIINPLTPGPLTGLGNSPVYLNSVPEPATTALLGLGLAVLFTRYCRLKLASSEGQTAQLSGLFPRSNPRSNALKYEWGS